MLYIHALFSWLVLGASSFVIPEQEPFGPSPADNKNPFDIIEELHHAEVIPDVLNTFTPLVTAKITWPHASASLGNTLSPSLLSSSPNISLTRIPSAYIPRGIQVTIALTDPDAPSRKDPKWSQVCHWIVTATGKKGDAKEVVEYKAPAPPEGTGLHRYVFVVLVPRNGTSERLHLSKPEERRHWGFEGERSGVREWADENGLVVIGANFIYAQNDKQ